jgi:hypothetical protein
MGLRAGLDAVVKRKIPSPLPVLEPPIIQSVVQRYTTEISWLLVLILSQFNPFPNFASYFTKINCNVVFLTVLSSRFSQQFVYEFLISHPSHPVHVVKVNGKVFPVLN